MRVYAAPRKLAFSFLRFMVCDLQWVKDYEEDDNVEVSDFSPLINTSLTIYEAEIDPQEK
jgi:hypothetical protein